MRLAAVIVGFAILFSACSRYDNTNRLVIHADTDYDTGYIFINSPKDTLPVLKARPGSGGKAGASFDAVDVGSFWWVLVSLYKPDTVDHKVRVVWTNWNDERIDSAVIPAGQLSRSFLFTVPSN